MQSASVADARQEAYMQWGPEKLKIHIKLKFHKKHLSQSNPPFTLFNERVWVFHKSWFSKCIGLVCELYPGFQFSPSCYVLFQRMMSKKWEEDFWVCLFDGVAQGAYNSLTETIKIMWLFVYRWDDVANALHAYFRILVGARNHSTPSAIKRDSWSKTNPHSGQKPR